MDPQSNAITFKVGDKVKLKEGANFLLDETSHKDVADFFKKSSSATINDIKVIDMKKCYNQYKNGTVSTIFGNTTTQHTTSYCYDKKALFENAGNGLVRTVTAVIGNQFGQSIELGLGHMERVNDK